MKRRIYLSHVMLAISLFGFAQVEAISWSASDTLSPPAIIAENPRIAADISGNAFAVWSTDLGDGYEKIQALYYIPGPGWAASPTTLSIGGPPGGNAYVPILSMDPSGNAMAVWQRGDGLTYITQAAYYTFATSTWSSPIDLSLSGEFSITPQFYFDGLGNGVIVWNNSTTGFIQSASYTQMSNSWSAITNISSVSSMVSSVHLSVNTAGNAIAVWLDFDGTNNNVLTSVYDAGTWSSAVAISAVSTNASTPRVAMDQNGNGIALWVTSNSIQAVTYTFLSSTWSAPITISPPGELAYNPNLSITSSTGDAVAVWINFDGSNFLTEGTPYLFSTNTWSLPTVLSTGSFTEAPVVACDVAGNAVAVWKQSNGTNIMVATSTYTFSGSTWSSPLILSNPDGDVDFVDVFTNPYAPTFVVFGIWQFTFDGINYVIQAATGS